MEVIGQLYAPAALSPGKEHPGTHWRGGLVGLRTGRDNKAIICCILLLTSLQLERSFCLLSVVSLTLFWVHVHSSHGIEK